MGGKPGLDVGATLGRQLVVDIGVQFVFGGATRLVNGGSRRVQLCGPTPVYGLCPQSGPATGCAT